MWGEICGTKIATPSSAIATAIDVATPDIITVTDCIETLTRANRMAQVDQVFREAVDLNLVLRGNLDSAHEFDLSGMSFPVARAAVRYILKQSVNVPVENLHEVTFITGVGKAQQQRRREAASDKKGSTVNKKGTGRDDQKDPTTSLREFVQDVLKTNFDPAIESVIPRLAQGTVEIQLESLRHWVEGQKKGSQ